MAIKKPSLFDGFLVAVTGLASSLTKLIDVEIDIRSYDKELAAKQADMTASLGKALEDQIKAGPPRSGLDPLRMDSEKLDLSKLGF